MVISLHIHSLEDYYPDENTTEEIPSDGVCEYDHHSALFFPVVYSLLFVVGVLGNGLVFWVVLAGAKLRSMTDVCLLNLAGADLLLLGALPFLAHDSGGPWVFGDAMCKIVLCAYYIGFYSGIFFVTLMSVDRYLAIVHAVYAMRARTRACGLVASVAVWIASVCASLPEIWLVSMTPGKRLECRVDYYGDKKWLIVFGLFKLNVLGLLVPLAVMGFCYSMILRRLLSCRLSRRQTVRLVLLVGVVFLCCWAPYNVTSFFKALEMLLVYTGCESSKAIHRSLKVTAAVAYSHSCLNPIIYVFVGRKFRRHLSKLVSRVPCVGCQFLKRHFSPAARSTYSQTTSVEERSSGL
ncbi:hypothetical protein AAFF_G00402440 [Aldrovandia affinis]|uniref:G-protein coupled receptors family 1 profile domain-containing protein n=1 Tax=Aldrovandia affinis TaxID=143900 RepID=A0AAD7T855_9TELE|nr:hypothetical protein AAFF_G00402440 [Aldrovandia affinis]